MFSLKARDVERLAKLLKSYEHGKLFSVPDLDSDQFTAPVETWIAYATTSIPAISGSSPVGATPGTATVKLFNLDLHTGKMAENVGDLEVTAWNISTTAVPSGFVLLVRDPISGQYFVIGCCGSGGGPGGCEGVTDQVEVTTGDCETTCLHFVDGCYVGQSTTCGSSSLSGYIEVDEPKTHIEPEVK